MPITMPTIIFEDLMAALEDGDAESYLNRRTGDVVRLYPDDRWKEQDDAVDAREGMAARPHDWLVLPHVGGRRLAKFLIRNGVYPKLV